ncbi:ABC transporter permease [Halobacteriaceae archaeon GCM10025711]
MSDRNLSGFDDQDEEPTLRQRVAENPRPALVWGAGLLVLVALEFGAVVHFGFELVHTVLDSLPGEPGAAIALRGIEAAADIPTLLSRELIPNEGYWNGTEWVDTFMGLSPKHSWLLRASLVYVYAAVFLWWLWRGYDTFRTHYRRADWTPRDDQVDRMRRHRWGQFGLVAVLVFLVMAMFAPTLGPTTLDKNIENPYSNEITYWDEQTEQVQEVVVGVANVGSGSQGTATRNVGPWTYDDFGRFHPFGTLTTGKDLFTFLVYGSRISLFIGLATMVTAALVAAALALGTAYYKGLADLLVVVTSDSFQALPVLMVVILMAYLFAGTWIASLYNGAILLVVVFALVYWPYLWRAVRGPSLQVSEQEWVDAAKSFGQRPRVIMEKHMAPYIVGYLFVYGSMSLGGVIVGVAGLSFLGLGITPPTPEWGRAINAGQPYVASASWHISLIPGILITIVVTGFNALGDGIRDAIDPQSEGGEGETEVVAAGSGGA